MAEPTPYRAMSIAELACHLRDAEESTRWRLVLEFLNEYRGEAERTRLQLLEDEPAGTGDARWDALLAALAEHVSARDGAAAPAWSEDRVLSTFWFPFNTAAARVDAVVHAPAAFRRRGIFVAARAFEVA